MKINEVILREEDSLSDYQKKAPAKKWKSIVSDPAYSHVEFEVDGYPYKGYIDNKANIFYVYDDRQQDFIPADPSFTRRAFQKNTSARIKNLLNFKRWEDVKAWWDATNQSKPGAGVAARYQDDNWFVKGMATLGARAGGKFDNFLKNRRTNKQQGTTWEQVYGVQPPKPGDKIQWKTSDNVLKTGEFIQFTSDTDGDGVPDVQIKGFFNPDNPKQSTTTGIPSRKIISINGVKLVPQKLSGKQKKKLTTLDPADSGIEKIDTSY